MNGRLWRFEADRKVDGNARTRVCRHAPPSRIREAWGEQTTDYMTKVDEARPGCQCTLLQYSSSHGCPDPP
jgi:hypothetical protein